MNLKFHTCLPVRRLSLAGGQVNVNKLRVEVRHCEQSEAISIKLPPMRLLHSCLVRNDAKTLTNWHWVGRQAGFCTTNEIHKIDNK